MANPHPCVVAVRAPEGRRLGHDPQRSGLLAVPHGTEMLSVKAQSCGVIVKRLSK